MPMHSRSSKRWGKRVVSMGWGACCMGAGERATGGASSGTKTGVGYREGGAGDGTVAMVVKRMGGGMFSTRMFSVGVYRGEGDLYATGE